MGKLFRKIPVVFKQKFNQKQRKREFSEKWRNLKLTSGCESGFVSRC